MAKIERQFGVVFTPTGFIISENEVTENLTTNNLENNGFIKYDLSTAFSKGYYRVLSAGDKTNDQLRTSMAWERCLVLEKVLTDLLGFKTTSDVFTGCIGFFSSTNEEVCSVYQWGSRAVMFYTRIDKHTLEGERDYLNNSDKLML